MASEFPSIPSTTASSSPSSASDCVLWIGIIPLAVPVLLIGSLSACLHFVPRTFGLQSNESIRFVRIASVLPPLRCPDRGIIHISGAQEVEWLKSQLKEKLRSTELGDSVRGDVQTLLTVLQCPVFGKIVTIEVSLHADFLYVYSIHKCL